MRKTLLLLSIATVLFCSTSCFEIPVHGLRVPYHQQDPNTNYCAVACIQMWEDYCWGEYTEQDMIAQMIMAGPQGATPSQTALGVQRLTNCPRAYVAKKPAIIPGADGDIIGGAIVSYENRNPSIIFVEGGHHAVLAKGFIYHKDSDGRPIADNIIYHDPRPIFWGGGSDFNESYTKFKQRYVPVQGTHWYEAQYVAVIDNPSSYYAGIEGHDAFVRAGGTYYGGPLIYNPKGLNIDFSFTEE